MLYYCVEFLFGICVFDCMHASITAIEE